MSTLLAEAKRMGFATMVTMPGSDGRVEAYTNSMFGFTTVEMKVSPATLPRGTVTQKGADPGTAAGIESPLLFPFGTLILKDLTHDLISLGISIQ